MYKTILIDNITIGNVTDKIDRLDFKISVFVKIATLFTIC